MVSISAIPVPTALLSSPGSLKPFCSDRIARWARECLSSGSFIPINRILNLKSPPTLSIGWHRQSRRLGYRALPPNIPYGFEVLLSSSVTAFQPGSNFAESYSPCRSLLTLIFISFPWHISSKSVGVVTLRVNLNVTYDELGSTFRPLSDRYLSTSSGLIYD